jgi:hypothetical protein
MKELTPEQLAAVAAFARLHGRRWKLHLRQQWEWARATPILHGLRNSHGPAWLATYRLNATPARRVQALDDAQRWVDTNGPAHEVDAHEVDIDPSNWRF